MEKLFFFKGLNDDSLVSTTRTVIEFAKQDIVELSILGLTQEYLDQAEAKVAELDNDMTHKYFNAEKSKTTTDKKDSAASLKQTIKQLKSATMYVPFTNVNASSIFNKNIKNINEAETLEMAKLILNTINEEPADLTIYGVKAELVSKLEAQINDLSAKKVVNQVSSVSLSDKTYDRNLLRAEISMMLKRINSIGKAYWEPLNKSRMRDYTVVRKAPRRSSSGESQVITSTSEGSPLHVVS